MASHEQCSWKTEEEVGLRSCALESGEDSDVSPVAARTNDRMIRAGALSALAAVVGTVCLVGTPSAVMFKGGVSAITGFSSSGDTSRQQALQVASQEVTQGSNLATAPKENLNDGNICNDDEEQYGALCYAKCSQLAGPDHTYRQSAWTCCKQAQCSLANLFSCCKHDAGACSGFSIAGMQEGSAICPHAPGGCLNDEELFLGMCFMKCSVLTGGLYPHRTEVDGCCKSSTGVGCMAEEGAKDGLNGMLITNSTFAVGG
eukprot:CAMPEP_0203941884 /NCGR_PEP_ID=MMETSP0359-20131031/78191_1 /ASSEMBLY_ACC=CAM_ASM_000338 /TAXON_ID=268821 /ORGANISM="Scrippsiella Hangoei, Strain SHTV-5" /LENGTH=258 /DNA_ID=CAMNT_0050872521 /DNA_START=1 /DNA_END=773 /DNA_ORIENTATION=-